MKAEVKYFFKKGTEISDKGLVRLVQGNKTTTLHYIKDVNKVLSLTLGSSEKVKLIKTDSNIKLGFALKSNDSVDYTAKIIDDKKIVKKLFDTMLTNKFTHYKKYSDDLVILEMTSK